MPENKIDINLGASLTGEDKHKIINQERSQDFLTVFSYEGDPGRVEPLTIAKKDNIVNNFISSPGRDRSRAEPPANARIGVHVNNSDSFSHKGGPDRDIHPDNAKVGDFVHSFTFNFFSSVNKKSIDNGDKIDTINTSDVELPEVEKLRGGGEKLDESSILNRSLEEETNDLIQKQLQANESMTHSVNNQRNPSLNNQRNHSLNIQRKPSLNIQRKPSLNTQRNPSLNIQRNPSLNIQRNPSLNIQRNPSLNIQRNPSLNIQRNPSLNIQTNSSLNIQRNPSLNIQRNPSLNIQRNSSLNTQRNFSLNTELETSQQIPDKQKQSTKARQNYNTCINTSSKKESDKESERTKGKNDSRHESESSSMSYSVL